ncbi:MAG: hypothetical protein HRT47_12680 [Candidatus Caenarcaniphilales bacterium]|nr:hypothetical protein [Candidatus Caenarcaniphilales bacterium]
MRIFSWSKSNLRSLSGEIFGKSTGVFDPPSFRLVESRVISVTRGVFKANISLNDPWVSLVILDTAFGMRVEVLRSLFS